MVGLPSRSNRHECAFEVRQSNVSAIVSVTRPAGTVELWNLQARVVARQAHCRTAVAVVSAPMAMGIEMIDRSIKQALVLRS